MNNKTNDMVKTMLKLGFSLSIFVAISCIGLAFVYSSTKDMIAEHATNRLMRSLDELFPGADFEPIEGGIANPHPESGIVFERAFAAKQNGSTIGAVMEVSTPSYSGRITLLVGTGTDARISRILILSNPDTPGLGSHAGNSSYFVDRSRGLTFYGQFTGKYIGDPFEMRQDIAVITASTITSRFVSDAVRAAGKAAFDWLMFGGM